MTEHARVALVKETVSLVLRQLRAEAGAAAERERQLQAELRRLRREAATAATRERQQQAQLQQLWAGAEAAAGRERQQQAQLQRLQSELQALRARQGAQGEQRQQQQGPPELLAPLQTSDVTMQEGVGGGISSNGGGGVSKLALEQLIAVPIPIQHNGLEIFGDNADPALNICTNLLKSYL